MINDFSFGEETEISDLILRVFDEFIGYEYSEKGKNTFRGYVSSQSISDRFRKGNMLLTCRIDNSIAGIIEVRDNNHISLFFVDPAYQKRGIGKALMHEVFKRLTGKTETISVNSSKYAEPVYKKLGFKRTGSLQEKDGIIFIPMEKAFL